MRSKILKILFCAMIITASSVFSFAQPVPKQESIVVAGITVEGNLNADVETIIALSGIKVGDRITIPNDEKLQSAVRNLWKRKQFSDVQFIVDKMTPLGAMIKIKVAEYPRLLKIETEDNKEISSPDIIKAAGKVRGDIITPYDMYLVKKSVKKMYAKEGLAFAKVEARLSTADSGIYRNMIIKVAEGVEFKVRKITFEGNNVFDASDLAGAFDKTKTKSWYQFWRSAKFNKEDYEKDITLLKNFLQKKGYMEAEILKDTVIYDESTESVYINVKLHEGNKYYVRNINFNGSTVYNEDYLKKRLEIQKGDIYNQEKFQNNLMHNEDQSDALSMYMDNGYLQARMEPTEKKIGSDSVDIEISVFEGERYTVGRVEIVKNTKTKDKVIRRELFTRPGEYFDRSAIIRSIKALGVLNYFNPEALQKPQVLPSSVDKNAVDITYTVEERSTDMINMSLGFAGSYGLTASIGLTFNNFSLLEPLKGGSGQVFNFNFETGQIDRYRTFSVGFTEPWLFDEPTTVGFNLFNTKLNYSDINLSRTGVVMNIGRRFRWPDDYFRGDWSVRYQFNDVNNVNGVTSAYYRTGKYSEVTISQRLSRTSLNNLFFPTSGSRFSFNNDFAMGALKIGRTDYLKTEFSFETFNPVMSIKGQDRVVFYLSSKFGYISGLSNDTTITPIELYRMGGNGLTGYNVTPLRGYEDNTIGISGGSKLMSKYSAELRLALSLDPMPLFIYGFAEAGNVWSQLKGADLFDLKRSAGVGIQMLLNPIGIIGFSYGYGFDPITKGTSASGWKFLFHLGQ